MTKKRLKRVLALAMALVLTVGAVIWPPEFPKNDGYGTGLQDLEMKKKQAACKDTLSDEISMLEKALEKYNRQKFMVYDEYTKGRMSREVMAEKFVITSLTAEISAAEILSCYRLR